MNNLTPQLTDAQLKANIDILLKKGRSKEHVQSYVDNYAPGPNGTYTLKNTGANNLLHQYTPTETPESDQGGFSFNSLGKALTASERGFGESIAGAAIGMGLPGTGAKEFEQAQQTALDTNQKFIDIVARRLKDKRSRGEDVTREIEQLKNAGAFTGFDASEFNPALNKSTKQILGEALGVAVDVASFGTYGSGFKTFSMAPRAIPSIAGQAGSKLASSFTQGAIKGAATGIATGGVFGAGQGVARGMQADKSTSEIVSSGITGGLFGAALGGVVGGLTGGISGALKGRQIRKRELQELIDTGDLSNKKLARYDITTLAKDKKATEAIRQGVDERSVAAIKTMSRGDKEKAIRMLDLKVKSLENARITERPFDITGETILAPAKKLSETLKSAGSQLDDVANGLKGQTVEKSDDIVRSVNDDILRIGATVDSADGSINFKGSTLEGVGGNEKILNNVYKRISEAKDAFDLHKVKRYIDNNVTYGKNSDGLVGEAERMLKDWRRLIDTSLDTQFTDYNKVNTVLSETINQLDELNSIMGRSFNINQPLAEIKAGQVASRMLGNGANRGDILRVLDNLQETAKKYGYESSDDIVNQVIFADTLDDLFGTQAPRSLQGQTERAIEQATGIGKEFAQGNYLKGATQAVVEGYKTVTGVTTESKIKALRALLGATDDLADDVAKIKPNMQAGFVNFGADLAQKAPKTAEVLAIKPVGEKIPVNELTNLFKNDRGGRAGDFLNTLNMYDKYIKAGDVAAESIYKDVTNKVFQPVHADQILSNTAGDFIESGYPELAKKFLEFVDVENLSRESLIRAVDKVLGLIKS